MILTRRFYVFRVWPLTAVILLIEEPSELLTVVGAAHQLAPAPCVRSSELHARPLPKGFEWSELLLAKVSSDSHIDIAVSIPLAARILRRAAPLPSQLAAATPVDSWQYIKCWTWTMQSKLSGVIRQSPLTWQRLQWDGFIVVPRQLWRRRDRRQRGTSDTWRC